MKHMNNHYGLQEILRESKLNLQLFADDEDEDDGDGENQDDSDEEDESEEDDSKGKKGKRTYTKKELGAIVAREVEKALGEERQKRENQKTEAQKLEDMTDEEKAAYRQRQKDSEMDELKRKVARMELSKTAAKLLRESELEPSDEILDFVVGKDAEETDENIKRFVKIKDAIVLAAEKARNTGKTPKVVTGGDGTKKLTKDDIIKMSYKDVLAYKTKHPEDYKKIMEA